MDRVTLLWQYRELVANLVMRDLKLRYKSSVLGFVWSLLNPLLLMIVFTVVFTIMLPNFTVPHFPVFVLCGLLPWNYFHTSVMCAITSISSNGHLIKKVYFPREVLTLSGVLSNLVNFLLALPVLLVFLLIFRIPFSPAILLLPVIVVIQTLLTGGVALALATLNVFFRDTSVIMEVILQAWFFLTPVFYPIQLLPEWQTVLGVQLPVRRLTYILNPMASVVATYRSILYGFIDGSPPAPPAGDFFLRTAVTALLCFLFGYWVFCRHSRRFAEEV